MYERLGILADQINAAADAGDREALNERERECATWLEEDWGAYAPALWYFRSNVHAALQDLEDPHSWEWRQPHREHQILYLRRARAHPLFLRAPSVTRAQIIVNLANSLDHLGRSLEAIALYDEALAYHDGFAMAVGNRGVAKLELARRLHDGGHAAWILASAHEDLTQALSDAAYWDADYPGAVVRFKTCANEIARNVDVANVVARQTSKRFPLGRSASERQFRRWALQESLFVNPLIVLGPLAVAATDHLGLPTHRATAPVAHYVSWFNQLTQEYAAARWLLYDAIHGEPDHYADRELHLMNALDGSTYGMATEKAKLSFRSAYSLLDKMAGFVNAYYALGDKPNRVDARNVWLGKNNLIRPEFAAKSNLCLRGLYWLMLDIVGKEPNAPDAIAPEAAELSRLRNALEHRGLIFRTIELPTVDDILESTTVVSFQDSCLTMLRLARSALVYLSLSVRQEEQTRHGADNELAMPFLLAPYRPS